MPVWGAARLSQTTQGRHSEVHMMSHITGTMCCYCLSASSKRGGDLATLMGMHMPGQTLTIRDLNLLASKTRDSTTCLTKNALQHSVRSRCATAKPQARNL